MACSFSSVLDLTYRTSSTPPVPVARMMPQLHVTPPLWLHSDCLSFHPLGRRISHDAFYRDQIVDKHGEDEGRHDRSGRRSHDGDLIGVVGSGPRFSSGFIVSLLKNCRFNRSYTFTQQSRLEELQDYSEIIGFSVENPQ